MSARERRTAKNTGRSKTENLETTDDGISEETECPICRQAYVLPIKLPCQHKFCYLCAKGAVTRSRSCPFCRNPVLLSYFEDIEALNMNLEKKEDEVPSTIWYYKARSGGWWTYDQRSSQELENRWKKDPEDKFEMLIAGFLYIIDLHDMKQIRKDNANSFREMKRDPANTVELRGYAGIGKAVYQKSSPKSYNSAEDIVSERLEAITLNSQPTTTPKDD